MAKSNLLGASNLAAGPDEPGYMPPPVPEAAGPVEAAAEPAPAVRAEHDVAPPEAAAAAEPEPEPEPVQVKPARAASALAGKKADGG